MSIARSWQLDERGDRLRQDNHGGSCTGCFQVGPWAPLDGLHTLRVQFGGEDNSWDDDEDEYVAESPSQDNWERAALLVESPLLKALVPGIKVHDEFTVDFPVFGVPVDRVITAMRLINSVVNGYGDEGQDYDLLDGFEEWQKVLICVLGYEARLNSDSCPSLSFPKLGIVDAGFGGYFSEDSFLLPTWGMLIPLLKGEIQPGIQPPMNVCGYHKGDRLASIAMPMSENRLKTNERYDADYRKKRAMYEGILDKPITVNCPIIHPSFLLSGPEVFSYHRHNRRHQEDTWKAGIEYLKQAM